MRISPKILTLYRRVKAVDTNKVTANGATKAYVGKLRITAKTNNTALTEIKLNNSKANEIDYSTVSTTLNNNSWEVINQVCADGRALEFWQYGDHKIDNDGNKWLFIDATPNRYPFDMGGYSQAVFISQGTLFSSLMYNSSGITGYSTSIVRDTLNSTSTLERLPDLFNIINKNSVIISSGKPDGSYDFSRGNKLFAPSMQEIKRNTGISDGCTIFGGAKTNAFNYKLASRYATRTISKPGKEPYYALVPATSDDVLLVINENAYISQRQRPCFALGAPNKTAWTLPSSITVSGTSLSLTLSANDYIEIDRLKKKAYLYKNGVVTDITSGTWSETVTTYDGTSTGLTRSNRIDSMLNMIMTDGVQVETKANNDVELTLEYITGVSQ